jgi:putative phosphoribosyl transferase
MFENRQQAGRQLGQRLFHLFEERPVVLGLPRGGVVVAAEVALALDAPLDVLVVRKLGAPNQPELAIGAVTNGDQPQRILNDKVIAMVGASDEYLQTETAGQLDEVRRRQALYRGGRSAVTIRERTVIVVDDGIATGATVRAGIRSLRQTQVKQIVLAVPVAPPQTAELLRAEVDELVCLATPHTFVAVGAFYLDFSQTTDAAVIAALERSNAAR